MISSFDPTSLGGRRRYLRTSVLLVCGLGHHVGSTMPLTVFSLTAVLG